MIICFSNPDGMRACMAGNANKVNWGNVTEAKRPIRAQDLSLVSRKWKMR